MLPGIHLVIITSVRIGSKLPEIRKKAQVNKMRALLPVAFNGKSHRCLLWYTNRCKSNMKIVQSMSIFVVHFTKNIKHIVFKGCVTVSFCGKVATRWYSQDRCKRWNFSENCHPSCSTNPKIPAQHMCYMPTTDLMSIAHLHLYSTLVCLNSFNKEL
jgi:hypothetical protein